MRTLLGGECDIRLLLGLVGLAAGLAGALWAATRSAAVRRTR